MQWISRRQFIALVAAGVASTIVRPSAARALENDANRLVAFSEEVAATIADNFVRSMEPGLPLKVGTIIPILNTEGLFKGYSVEYLLSGAPSGYVVLEVDYPGLIASFSFSEGSLSQGRRALDELLCSNDRRSVVDTCLIEVDPFCMGYYDEYSGCVISLDSKSQAKPSLVENLRTRTSWTDVLISQDEINNGGFTAGSTKYSGELAYITQGMAERGNKRYACGPHALYVIGAALPNDQMNAPIIPDATSNWSCYNKLWDYSGTKKLREDHGVVYGSTASDRLGPAFVRLCAERRTTMRQSYTSNPSFLSIVTHINNVEVAVMGAGVKTSGGDSGHFLAANGYAYLHRKSDNKALQCVAVFDGWDSYQFFNFDFPSYNFKNTTFLYRKK